MIKRYFTLFLLLTAAFNVIAQPTSGLVAYYPFNGNANDGTSNGNNGTVYGASLTTDRFGNSNQAYTFNGSSNYILVPNSSSLQSPTTGFTVSAWVNATDTSVLHWIVDKRMNTGFSPYTSYVLCTNNNKWRTGTMANSEVSAGKAPIVVGTWVHLLATYNGSKVILYVNGIPNDSVSVTGNVQYTTQPLYIGKSPTNSAYMKGKIDDIRIYNRALNINEIYELLYEGCNFVFSAHPRDTSILESKPGFFAIKATGTSIGYQWQVNSGSGYSNVTSCYYNNAGTDSLSIPYANMGMNGNKYRCVVSNSHCRDTSNEATLTIDTVYFNTVYDTSNVTVYDSIDIIDTVEFIDTVQMMVYDTISIYDSVNVNVYDTTLIIVYDSVTINVYDTVQVIVYDSVYVSVTDTLIIYATFTGMPSPGFNYIKIYPNPAKDHIYIDNGNFMSMSGCTVKITNSAGQTVFTSPISQPAFYVDLSTWSGRGLYYVQILDSSNKLIEIKKIILR